MPLRYRAFRAHNYAIHRYEDPLANTQGKEVAALLPPLRTHACACVESIGTEPLAQCRSRGHWPQLAAALRCLFARLVYDHPGAEDLLLPAVGRDDHPRHHPHWLPLHRPCAPLGRHHHVDLRDQYRRGFGVYRLPQPLARDGRHALRTHADRDDLSHEAAGALLPHPPPQVRLLRFGVRGPALRHRPARGATDLLRGLLSCLCPL